MSRVRALVRMIQAITMPATSRGEGWTQPSLDYVKQCRQRADCLTDGLVRYCHECGHIGEVAAGKLDCCPDGSHAELVPLEVARQAQAGFLAGIREDVGTLHIDGNRLEDIAARSCCEKVTVRYDLSTAQVEGAIRDKLIEIGWTPPGVGAPAGVPAMSDRVKKEVVGWLTDSAHEAAEEDFDTGVFADHEVAEALSGIAAMLSAAPDAPSEQIVAGEWAIDKTTGRDILTYKTCSVIEDEQAHYVLKLIQQASAPADAVANGAEILPGQIVCRASDDDFKASSDAAFYSTMQARDMAKGCHRSNPHENMSPECQRKTEEARELNRQARECGVECGGGK